MRKLRQIQQIYATGTSVDWIVLTASCIGLAVVIAASISAGSDGAAAQAAIYFAGTDAGADIR